MRTDVLIIGGGIAGLACAVGLRGSGLHVTVCEGSATLGGRAQSWVDGATGDTVDIGPHVLLSIYRNMLRFLELLGTRDLVLWQREKLMTFVNEPRPTHVRLHRVPEPLHLVPSMIKTRTVGLGDKLSNLSATLFAMPLLEADIERLDRTSAYDVLRDLGVSERFIEWFWASAAMTVMNVPLERASAGSILRLYQQLIGHNDLAFGFPRVGLGELFAPAAAHLIRAAGGEVRLRHQVRRLTFRDGVACGAELDDGLRIEARVCIAAIPPHGLARLLPTELQLEHRSLGDLETFEPSPYVSTYLWFDRKLSREKSWARVWSPNNLNYDFYDLSNIRIGWERRPSIVATNIIYSHRAHDLTDDAIVRATVRELADYLPNARSARLVHARVHRIPMAIPCPVPGFERRRPPTRTPVRGLILAGDWTRTALPACMEGAVRSGWLAAEAVLADLGRPRRIALDPPELEGIAGLVRRGSRILQAFDRRPGNGSCSTERHERAGTRASSHGMASRRSRGAAADRLRGISRADRPRPPP